MKMVNLALRVTTFAYCAFFFGTAALPLADAQTETVLFNFTVASLHPAGPLLMDSAGNFFGASPGGGPIPGGYGTVWELVNSSGTYTQKILYTFGATSTDGLGPYRGVVMDSAGNIYGTTSHGGTADQGIAFELVKSGGNYTEKILYNFGATPGDGVNPYSNVLLDSAGNLFGTTGAGGTAGFGTVFELVYTSGTYTETVLHSFAGPPSDGEVPIALLMDASGNLYGATGGGGTQNCGTVFELVNSSGTYSEKVLYSFGGPPNDGTNPTGLSMDSNGNFYGATGQGTVSVNCCGTVFELLNNSGNYAERILYSFTGGADGGGPNSAPIMDASGKLYGTTSGSVFELMNSSGSYRAYVLHAFTGSPNDGAGPDGLVLDAAGNLYGITGIGGLNGYDTTGGSGYGTFFEIPNASAVNVIFSPNALNFGGGLMGKTATQSITVNNVGTAGLTFGSGAVTRSGANVADFAIKSDACSGQTLAPSTGTCTVSVTYSPSVIGAETASLTFADNGFGNPQGVPLSGTGQDFTLTALQATATVSPGNSAAYTLNITPLGGFTGTVALSCAGAPANSTCTVSPPTVTPDGTNFIQSGVLIWANESSARSANAPGPSVRPRLALSLLLGCVLGSCLFVAFGVKRASTRLLATLAFLIMLAFTVSCGGANGGGHAGYHGPPPASGTYTLTITGTSGGVTHNLTLTLVVQ